MSLVGHENFEFAVLERTAPYVFWRSLKPSPQSVAPQIYHRFENAYRTTLARNTAIFEELKAFLTRSHQENIRVLVFKGAYLARHVYEDPGLRPMTDIDFLIDKKDIARADALLVRLGYARPFDEATLALADLNDYNNSILYHPPAHAKAFMHLHWHLINSQPYRAGLMKTFDIAGVWQEARDTSFDGVSCKTLGPSHHLMFMCFHSFKHAFRPFLSLVDMAIFLEEHPELKREEFAQQARAQGLAPYVYHAAVVLQSSGLGGVEFWRDVALALKPEKVSVFERRFLAAALRQDKHPPMAGLGWALFGMNRTWRDRMAFVRRSFFPTRREMAFIRQKDIDKVGWRDYASRFLMGVR